MRRIGTLIGSVVGVALLAGSASACDDGSDARDGSAPAADEGSEVASAAAGGGRTGCPANGGEVPTGAVTATVADVDGDHRDDQVWYSTQPSQRVGLRTASGAVVGTTIETARPVSDVTVVDADERGGVEVLVSDGSIAHLHVFDRCELRPVTGPDGRRYGFDLGYLDNGTGVICTDADGDGRRDLLGVNAVDDGDGTATVSRTVVRLEGATARHGDTDESRVEIDADRSVLDDNLGVRCGEPSITPEMIDEMTSGRQP